MADDSKNVVVTYWWDAKPPFSFGLSTEGQLMVEWGIDAPHPFPQARYGILIPAEESRNLLSCLQQTQAIQETLAAKPPKQGAH